MINGLCKNGKVCEAYELLVQMEERGFKPDTITFNAVKAFVQEKEVDKAMKLLE